MYLALIIIPAVFAAACYAAPRTHSRLVLLVAGTFTHFCAVLWSWTPGFNWVEDSFFGLDPLAHLFVSLVSLLFLATSIYFLGYHRHALLSERIFLACMLGLLAALSAVCMSLHFGVLWVSMEAASLAATPLIYFRLSARALEATWKFLLMNSVGIALALLGIFCLAVATLGAQTDISLGLGELTARARELDMSWLRAGFLLMLVGFGTKMGLAPLHSWKPDAYGEAPPPVAALLSGGMTLAAFLAILRVFQVCAAAGLARFAGDWLIVFGLLSICTAAVFIVGIGDYRRLLAYTSVEHMGVMVTGIGLGTAGSYASMIHAAHNTLNKGILFFAAGFLWRLYESNRVGDVRGALRHHPAVGLIFLGGLCATSALPPFGMFFSELGILFSAAAADRWWVLGVFSVALCTVFVGVMTSMLPMIFGPPPEAAKAGGHAPSRWETMGMLTPAAALLILAFTLGAYQPAPVRAALEQAACSLNPSSADAHVAAAALPGEPSHD